MVLAITLGEQLGGNSYQRVRKIGERGKIVLRHTHKLVSFAIAGDLHPVIFEQLEANFSVGQQPDEVEKFLGRNGASAFFFDS